MITITSFKGGAGSTTMLLLLAHFLSSLGKKIILIDCSADQYLTTLYDRSVLLEESLPFEFFSCTVSKAPMLIDGLKADTDAILLTDLPKFSFEQPVFSLYQKLQLIIIPFQYGFISISPAVRLAITAEKALARCKLTFLPNLLFANNLDEERLLSQQQALREIAGLSAAITYQTGLSQLTSMHLPAIWLINCSPALHILANHYIFSLP